MTLASASTPFTRQFDQATRHRLWERLKKDASGYVVAIVLDEEAGDLLMQAFMDEEAFLRTLETGLAHYHSRSRNCLWLKGETSGHFQHVLSARVDCDGDALALFVHQEGAACHTGNRSCFYRDLLEIVPQKSLSSVQETGIMEEKRGGVL